MPYSSIGVWGPSARGVVPYPAASLLLADFGASPDRVADETLAGVFDDSPTPKVLDFAEIGLDRFAGFAIRPAVRIGRTTKRW